MILIDFFNKIQFWRHADRIGPDIPWTHWRLFIPPFMTSLCKKQFHQWGDFSEFRPGAYAITCSNISIGNNVTIRPTTMIFADNDAGVEIENDVLISAGVHIYVNDHRFNDTSIPIIDQGYTESKPVKIKSGAWIGVNSIILKGVTIGKNSVVMAGSVVTKSVPDFSIVSGIPAKIEYANNN